MKKNIHFAVTFSKVLNFGKGISFKRNILSLVILLAPFFLFAQPYSNKEKMLISSRVDSLLTNFMLKSSLTQPGTTRLDNKVFEDFKELFSPDAVIFDDINARFDPNEKVFPYKLESKKYDDYFIGMGAQFTKGLVVSNSKINISYDDFDKGEVKAALARKITGTVTKGKYEFSNSDTLLIIIAIQKDLTVKIKGIEPIGNRNNLKVVNDKDYDGVINSLDECPNEGIPLTGKLTVTGCPDSDGDGVPNYKDHCKDSPGPAENNGCPATTFAYTFVFSGSAGLQMNQTYLKMPESPIENPAHPLDEQGKIPGSAKIVNPTFKGGLYFNANIAYYFGKQNNKTKGISLGVSFMNYQADYGLNGIKYVFKESDGVQEYHRIITIHDNSTENLSFNIINVPLLFKYKARFSGKWAFELGAGASFIYFYSAQAKHDIYYDAEGAYQYTSLAADNNYRTEYDISKIGTGDQTHDFILQYDIINGYDGNTNILFDKLLPGADPVYDFGLNKRDHPDKRVSSKDHNGIGADATADLFYHVGPKTAIKLGFTFIYAPSIVTQKRSYTMIDKTTDPYTSIYDSNGKSKYTSFGLNFGIIIGI
ncbi:MAG: thrombospondin type 3 repeat-containing protein [Bacteroidota bacterium]